MLNYQRVNAGGRDLLQRKFGNAGGVSFFHPISMPNHENSKLKSLILKLAGFGAQNMVYGKCGQNPIVNYHKLTFWGE